MSTNKNVVNVVINDNFSEQCIIDTGSPLSFVDNSFVRYHRLTVNPLKPGDSRVFMAAGETTIRAIGSTTLLLPFVERIFLSNFK